MITCSKPVTEIVLNVFLCIIGYLNKFNHPKHVYPKFFSSKFIIFCAVVFCKKQKLHSPWSPLLLSIHFSKIYGKHIKEPMDITKIIRAHGVSCVQWSPVFFWQKQVWRNIPGWKKSIIEVRNRVGIGLSYRPARLHTVRWRNWFLGFTSGSELEFLKSLWGLGTEEE